MSEFKLSTLVMILILLVLLGGYSYWQIYSAKQRQRKNLMPVEAQEGDFDLPEEGFNLQQDAKQAAWSHVPSLIEPQMPVEQLDKATDRDSDKALDQEFLTKEITTQPVESTPLDEVIVFYNSAFDESGSQVESQVIPPKVSSVAIAPIESKVEKTSKWPDTAKTQLEKQIEESVTSEKYSVDESSESSEPSVLLPVEDVRLDPQFFNQQDQTEQATLSVFEPLIRFSSWIDSTHPAPIHTVDGVLDLIVRQPKNTQDIERALYDLRLDTDLPLRIFGLRAGQIEAMHTDNQNAARLWQPLEQGVLYSGLRLTLQLANASEYTDTQLIHDWFELGQRFAKRLAAQVQAWPDPAALVSYAVYLHGLSQRLRAPLIVQLHKPQGLWAGYEVHQQMTQWGLQLDANGQYVARHENGNVLYRVMNDLNNPRAQDFFRDGLATMHVHTLSFCLDLARIDAIYSPEQRMWHDMVRLADALQAQWCNGSGQEISTEQLFAHAAEHVPAYAQQLAELGAPAGSMTISRLLQRTAA